MSAQLVSEYSLSFQQERVTVDRRQAGVDPVLQVQIQQHNMSNNAFLQP